MNRTNRIQFSSVCGLSIVAGCAGHATAAAPLAGSIISQDVEVVSEYRIIAVAGSDLQIHLWTKDQGNSKEMAMYAFQDADGLGTPQKQRPMLTLRTGSFDPLVTVPEPLPGMHASVGSELFLVQFMTSPRIEYIQELERLGAEPMPGYVPDQAMIVRMSGDVRDQLKNVSWVRWIGPVQPEMKIIESRNESKSDDEGRALHRFEIVPVSSAGQVRLFDRIEKHGGVIERLCDRQSYIDAYIHDRDLMDISRSDDVFAVTSVPYMQTESVSSRITSGANVLSMIDAGSGVGYTGNGVRGEIFDNDLKVSNAIITDIPNIPIIRSNPGQSANEHGTGTYSILFSATDSMRLHSDVAGMLPDGQGIFNSTRTITSFDPFRDPNILGLQRDCVTRPLNQLATDPVFGASPPEVNYRAVLQSCSWNFGLSQTYDSGSQELDRIGFYYDFLVLHGTGNNGTTGVGRESIAKNALTAGGIIHHQTPTDLSDDSWEPYPSGNGVSAPGKGPVDVVNGIGRVKPDLAQISDDIWAAGFFGALAAPRSGVSFSTPSVAGSAGLVFEMWGRQYPLGSSSGENIFRASLSSVTGISDTDVFENRPGPAVVKALLINSASPYDWNQDTDNDGIVDPSSMTPNNSITRDVQGWGVPDLKKLYSRALWYQESVYQNVQCLLTPAVAPVMYVNPESTLLAVQGASFSTCFQVTPTDTELRVSLVWSDPPPSLFAGSPLVNNLDLKVTAPDGTTVYRGNVGLVDDGDPLTNHGIWSVSGGSYDETNNVENVFIQGMDLQVGNYEIEVIATEINADGNLPVWTGCSPDTPPIISGEMDVKFALVVTRGPCVADYNQDGVVDTNDVNDYLSDYGMGDPRADLTFDGSLDFLDLSKLMSEFTAGCP